MKEYMNYIFYTLCLILFINGISLWLFDSKVFRVFAIIAIALSIIAFILSFKITMENAISILLAGTLIATILVIYRIYVRIWITIKKSMLLTQKTQK